MKTKNVYIIAGPNGSGKTTFANEFLPEYAKCPNFVNADLIAKGLSPFYPRAAAIKAGRLVLEQIRSLAEKNVDFAFETTLSGKSYVRLIEALKNKGYTINLFFLWIPNADFALGRIKDRVASGGHDVPAVDVKRRFNRGIYNFFKYYKPLSDTWLLFNNADAIPRLIAKEKDEKTDVIDKEMYEKIIKSTR
ncbi:MAG: zeta toxin family protein [Candidatus Omnitrophota bacterium]|nr:zeta toxin family protein [Candidatus Omnitrophota bacterium]